MPARAEYIGRRGNASTIEHSERPGSTSRRAGETSSSGGARPYGKGRWSEPPAWLLAAVAALAWLLRYASKYGVHLTRPPKWADYFDQGRYIASASAFAHGNLSAAAHWYPLAYSALAAPFVWLIPHEPFFLLDLSLFVATLLGFVAVMRRVSISASLAAAAFLLGNLVAAKTARLWLEPWTTSLTAPLLWGVIAQALSIVDRPAASGRVVLPPADAAPVSPAPPAWQMALLGLLAGALPLVRPGDGVMGGVAILFTATMLWRQHRIGVSGLCWIGCGVLALWAPYALLHLSIYGAHATDYMRASVNQGFAFSDLPWKAYVVLVSAAPWFPDSPSLIEAMPWAVPGFAGLGLAWWCGDRRAHTALVLMALVAVPYTMLFLAYTDLQPSGLWRFGNAHYFKWLFPLLAVGCWVWLRALVSRRGVVPALVALTIILLPMTIRPLPMAVPAGVPARMLMFHGITGRFWNEAYFAPVTIADARGSMINVGRFHQIPDDGGERAVAVSRLFVGPALRDDPGETPSYRHAEPPYARYAVRLSVGIPCWLRRQSACKMPPPNG